MIVRDICSAPSVGGEGYTLSATVESDRGRPFHMEFVVDGAKPPRRAVSGDAFLAATLPVTMALGERLRIEAPVSARLLASTADLMAIYHHWGVGDHPVEVLPDRTEQDPDPHSHDVAAFFSAGVDSFYTLLKPRPSRQRISHLVLVFGFDCDERNRPIFEELVDRTRRVAEKTDRHPVTVHTNLRQFADPIVDWSLYHGAALASVGLALEESFRTVLVGSTHAYRELVPWGSHPLMDHLWSTESTEFIHDGAEALRSEKIAAISRSPVAMENLRVCVRKKSRRYNCGICEKCLRTMVGLQAVRALADAPTFPHTIDVDRLRRIPTESESSVRFLRDLLVALGPAPEDRPIRDTLQSVIRRATWRLRAQEALRWSVGPRRASSILETYERIRDGVSRRVRRWVRSAPPEDT